MDTINLCDADNNKVEVLSVLDMASGYHVVKQIHGRKSTDLLADFTDCWMVLAGPPMKVTCDQERGFIKDFADGVEMAGSTVRFVAGQAHWQQGTIERQGEWYRAMWDKAVAHSRPSEEEINYTLAMVSAAKNNLRQKHGYSPAQRLFGAEPRVGDAIFDQDLYYKEELRSPDEVWRRRQTIQLAAFLQTQAGTPLRRALLGRPRSNVDVYEQGDYVYIYIYRVNKTAGGKARKRQNAGEWIAPGVVVGREGSSYWVSPGGWCVLCAAKHLRPAESEGLGLVFQFFHSK